MSTKEGEAECVVNDEDDGRFSRQTGRQVIRYTNERRVARNGEGIVEPMAFSIISTLKPFLSTFTARHTYGRSARQAAIRRGREPRHANG